MHTHPSLPSWRLDGLCLVGLNLWELFVLHPPQEFLCDPKFSDEEDLEEKLAVFKGETFPPLQLYSLCQVQLLSQQLDPARLCNLLPEEISD